MRNLFKNIICLLLINIFANASPLEGCLILILMYHKFTDEISVLQLNGLTVLVIIIYLLLILRLLVLPFAYKKLENSQNYKLVSQFIHKLKQSNYLKLTVLVIAYFYLKLTVLVIAYFCYYPTGVPYFSGDFYGQLIQGGIFGLFGSYIVLYIYWYIEDKIKNRNY